MQLEAEEHFLYFHFYELFWAVLCDQAVRTILPNHKSLRECVCMSVKVGSSFGDKKLNVIQKGLM